MCNSLDELCDTVSDYISFCYDCVTVSKHIKLYPNSKPWITQDTKQLLLDKQIAFRNRDIELQQSITKCIKKAIWCAKLKYKQKIEACFSSNNARETWSCLRTMTGFGQKKSILVDNVDNNYVNNMNSFFARFEDNDCARNVSLCISPDDDNVIFEEGEVRNEFSKLNIRKASGPDHVSPKVLKLCSDQLSYIFTFIMNLSMESHSVPSLWKRSVILPIPKRPITVLNDFRPIALTSVAMKCMEKLILKRVRSCFDPIQDPFQFAYRSKRSVEDAILLLLDNAYSHLDKPKSLCRILFLDFSSAFNTINPVILIESLKSMNINSHISAWIYDFLTNRTQFVNFQNVISNVITTNTGSPQGCVLSPVLFTMYTNACSINKENVKLIKFADDSCIEGLISNYNDELSYKESVANFTSWCDQNKLLLNTDKTKELIIDFRNKKEPVIPLTINGTEIEQVSQYKYLGVIIDNKLNWEPQASAVFKKINKRMFFLRKLSSFNVDNTLLYLFYNSVIQSIVCFCIIAWGGNTLCKSSSKINRVIKRASRITGHDLPHVDWLLRSLSLRKINSIENTNHPLAVFVKRSVRSNRPLLLSTKTERHKRSFLPFAISLLEFHR